MMFLNKSSILFFCFFVLQGCVYSIVSRDTGGYGVVTFNGQPVEGIVVSIQGLEKSFSDITNEKGAFDIKVKSPKRFHPIMDNPIYHDVEIMFKKDNVLLQVKSIERSVFDENYINLGTIELNANKNT